ncbi:MAG: sulfatase-like hydrolase/transferase, partial [Planctomycetota bacterium]
RANVEKYRRLGARSPERSALAEDLDAGAGRVIDAVDRLGLGRNTYVIYYSDNGGGGVLTGGKGSLYEGGIRMPLIVRGPGVAAGSWCHVPVTGVDFFPTFCEWAGVPTARLPSRLEGGSIASLLTDNGQGEVDRAREGLLFHFPHYQGRNTPHSALILDGMKGLYDYENSRFRLFDLTADLGEQRDLASARPAEAALMQGLLEQYLREDGAGLPVMNSQYDPVKAAASAQSRGPRSRTEGRTRPGQGPGPERRRGRPGSRQG